MNRSIVAVDAMGGDNAPFEIVKGAAESSLATDTAIILVGRRRVVEDALKALDYDKARLSIVDAEDVIGFDEVPTMAIKKKKNSSVVVGLNLLKSGAAHAFVSAGSTGALLTGASLIVGRIRGANARIERPFLATILPTEKGVVFLADSGANADCKPSFLLQFALVGSVYMEHVLGIKNPSVGLVNIGAEKEKGNVFTKETYALFESANMANINFVGNVEPRDIPAGAVDIAVCDGFTGNVILKLTEGLTRSLLTMIKSACLSTTKSKVGGFLIKDAMKTLKGNFDPSEHGGAPFLGLESLVVKTHGTSDAKTIKNAIKQCSAFIDNDIAAKIAAIL